MGKDVAEALGYTTPSNALQVHVDDEDKTTTLIQCTGSKRKNYSPSPPLGEGLGVG